MPPEIVAVTCFPSSIEVIGAARTHLPATVENRADVFVTANSTKRRTSNERVDHVIESINKLRTKHGLLSDEFASL